MSDVDWVNVGVVEVAPSGASFRVEINGQYYYISRKKLLEVEAGRRAYTEVSLKVAHVSYAVDRETPLTKAVSDEMRGQVLDLNFASKQH